MKIKQTIMAKRKQLLKGLIDLRLTVLFIFFLLNINIGFAQDWYEKCCLSSSDTLIMIGAVGGKRILIEKEYLCKQKRIKLNIEGLKIISYEYGLWGVNACSRINSDKLPVFIRKHINESYSMFFIRNIELETIDNKRKILETEFIIYIKYPKKK